MTTSRLDRFFGLSFSRTTSSTRASAASFFSSGAASAFSGRLPATPPPNNPGPLHTKGCTPAVISVCKCHRGEKSGAPPDSARKNEYGGDHCQVVTSWETAQSGRPRSKPSTDMMIVNMNNVTIKTPMRLITHPDRIMSCMLM
jgi:hypothetical protein